MLLKHLVYSCDFTDKSYPEGAPGAWCLAQGATGRWCCVMYMGPDYLIENNLEDELIDEDEAEKQALDKLREQGVPEERIQANLDYILDWRNW